MRQQEWIAGSSSLLKTDFEHHGLGKTELNITDPAYDLVEAILYWGLSPSEETKLIGRYNEGRANSKRPYLPAIQWSRFSCINAGIADVQEA